MLHNALNRMIPVPAISAIGIFLLGISLPGSVYPAWTNVSPAADGSGPILGFALSPSSPAIIYGTTTDLDLAGDTPAEMGVWKSLDSGANWAQVSNAAVYAGAGVATNSSLLALAGVQGGVIHRTTDGGATAWSATPSASHDAWEFEFVPPTSSSVYAVGLSSGPVSGSIQKSTDSGANWFGIVIGGDANPPVYSIDVDPNSTDIVYAGARPTGGAPQGLYKSTDGGTSWNYLANLPFTQVDAVAVDPNNSNLVYAGTAGSGSVRRSTDGGTTWAAIHNPGNVGSVATFGGVQGIAIDPTDSRVIYVVGGTPGFSMAIASTDCGATWVDVTSTGIPSIPSRVEIDPINNFVYVLENVAVGEVRRENLLAAGAGGACPAGTSPPDPGASADDDSGGSSSSAMGPVTLILVTILGLFRSFRARNQ